MASMLWVCVWLWPRSLHVARECRRVLGFCDGQHKRVEGRGTAIGWGPEFILEVSALVSLPVC